MENSKCLGGSHNTKDADADLLRKSTNKVQVKVSVARGKRVQKTVIAKVYNTRSKQHKKDKLVSKVSVEKGKAKKRDAKTKPAAEVLKRKADELDSEPINKQASISRRKTSSVQKRVKKEPVPPAAIEDVPSTDEQNKPSSGDDLSTCSTSTSESLVREENAEEGNANIDADNSSERSPPESLEVVAPADPQWAAPADPQLADPADPELADPIDDPELADPVDDPELADPVDDPELADPVDDPELADPVADPELPDPIEHLNAVQNLRAILERLRESLYLHTLIMQILNMGEVDFSLDDAPVDN